MNTDCPCGQPGVKKIADFWTCADCLKKDAVVKELHLQAVDSVDKMTTQDEAMRHLRDARTQRQRSYLRNKYWLYEEDLVCR